MYGRGSYDMKGGLAACLAAVKALRDGGHSLAGDVLLVSVADEEEASLGIQTVLLHHAADACIVTEPTDGAMVVAHKGFCWLEVETLGRAAHGSRWDEGIDANLRMGRVLSRVEALGMRLLASAPHPLLGPPSLHAATLHGGTGPSTYAASCRLLIERRMLPGETADAGVAEVQAIVDDLAAADPTFRATVHRGLARPGWEAAEDSAIADVVARAAAEVRGRAPAREGASFWMDASLIAAAGIDTVVFGPTGGGAHAAEEWVELDSVREVAEVLARSVVEVCGGG